MNFKHLFALLFLVQIKTTLRAQNQDLSAFEVEYSSFRPLGIEHGLSQGMVTCIIQDSEGFMWFATKDGLNKYDGVEFTRMYHDERDTNSISNNWVSALTEDSNKNIWIGYLDGSIDKYNPSTNKITHIVGNQTYFQPLNNRILKIESFGENLFATSTNQIIKININTNTVKEIKLPNEEKIGYINILNDGSIIANIDSRIAKFDSSGGIIRSMEILNNRKIFWNLEIQGIISIPNSNTTFVIRRKSIIKIDNHKMDISDIWSIPELTNCCHRMAIIENFLFISDTSRTIKTDIKTGKSVVWTSKNKSNNYKLNIESFYKDKNNTIWLGTRGFGLLKSNPKYDRFQFFESKSVGSISKHNGKIVIRLTDYPNNHLQIVQNSKGTFVTHYYLKDDFLVPGMPYFDSFEDNESNLWLFGIDQKNQENLITRVSKSTNRIVERIPIPDIQNINNKSFLFTLLVQAIFTDYNNIWIGTASGLMKFNRKTKEWSSFSQDNGILSSKINISILSMAPDPYDPQTFIWLGTEGYGLWRYNKKDGSIKKFTIANGLPNNVIYGILEDKNNKFWISSNKGIFNFDTRTFKINNYTEEDGLQSNEFNRKSYAKDSKGLMYFGGINGFNVFNPNDFEVRQDLQPKVIITNIEVSNTPIQEYLKKPQLPYQTTLIKNITLPHNYKIIKFQFAAIDFISPLKNEYKVKMENFDDEWNTVTGKPQASYTSLPPGDYIFRVIASNSSGVWNNEGVSIKIHINKPWWETWFFRIIVLVLISALLFTAYISKINHIKQVNDIRDSISRDLHDEIGSNLSNINILSKVAEKTIKPDALKHVLSKISMLTQTSQESMNDIVWMVNTEYDNLDKIVARMISYASNMMDMSEISYQMAVDPKVDDYTLKMIKRKNFYLIFKEAINNLCKYSDCTHVSIEISVIAKHIVLSIEDNGKGYDPVVAKKGNGIKNMYKRTNAINGTLEICARPEKGSKIKLTVPFD